MANIKTVYSGDVDIHYCEDKDCGWYQKPTQDPPEKKSRCPKCKDGKIAQTVGRYVFRRTKKGPGQFKRKLIGFEG